MTPDFCPSCDATDKPFTLIQRETEQDFRGETFRITSTALQCRHCGFCLLGPGHLDALRLATHDAYRRNHGLLTRTAIISRRKAMGLSQKRFADYLGVGSASVERWESGVLVQDKASDILLRQRTDHTRFLPTALSGKRTDKTVFHFTLNQGAWASRPPSSPDIRTRPLSQTPYAADPAKAVTRVTDNTATYHFTNHPGDCPDPSTPTRNPSHAFTPAA